MYRSSNCSKTSQGVFVASFNHGGHKIWVDCFFHLHYDNGYSLYMGRVGKNPFQCVRGCEMHLQKHFWCKLRPTIIISLCYPIVSLVCDEKTLQLPTWRNLASNMIALHRNGPFKGYWIVNVKKWEKINFVHKVSIDALASYRFRFLHCKCFVGRFYRLCRCYKSHGSLTLDSTDSLGNICNLLSW